MRRVTVVTVVVVEKGALTTSFEKYAREIGMDMKA